MSAGRQLLLIRHGEIESRFKGICYGRTDVGLSQLGRDQSRAVASRLEHQPTAVMTSDLSRARFLADRLARRHGLDPIVCRELRERDFGDWELRSWDDVYAETGDAMDGMVSAPDAFRPPGGETTFELRDRVLHWYRRLPREGCIVAVTHGGPIAALLGSLERRPVVEWPGLVPSWGEVVEVTTDGEPAIGRQRRAEAC